MTESLAVDAVVVQFGAWALAQTTLESLRLAAPQARVFVVDNGTVGLPAPPSEPRNFELLSPGRNLGYGAACNLAAHAGTAPYLLFLNNDAEVRAGAVEAMADALERDPRAAAVGPLLLGPDGSARRSIHRAPTPRRVFFESLFLPRLVPGLPFFHGHHTAYVSHRRAQEVETLSGAAVMVRRRAFDAVGGFDEDFFFYAEESDLFARLRASGWRILFEPAARVVHHGGIASALVPAGELDTRLSDGLKRYARKHHGPRGEAWTSRALLWGARLRWALAHFQTGRRGIARRRRYAEILGRSRPR
jgi:GT2 family glycosyltransferase